MFISGQELNTAWYELLKMRWETVLWGEKSALRKTINDLRISMIPVAILPFEDSFLYAKYIELENDKYKMLLVEKRTKKQKVQYAIGRGLFFAIQSEAPYLFIKYLKVGKKRPIYYKSVDDDLYKEEQKILKKCIAECQNCMVCGNSTDIVNSYTSDGERKVFNFTFEISDAINLKVVVNDVVMTLKKDYTVTSIVETGSRSVNFKSAPANNSSVTISNGSNKSPDFKGHLVVPLYYGIIPLYVLIVPSNLMNPEIFETRYVRETLEMICNIGESVIADEFESMFEEFCEKISVKMAPGTSEKLGLIKEVENKILGYAADDTGMEDFLDFAIAKTAGKEPKRNCSSWIHSLPGHWVHNNKRLVRITKKFVEDWKDTRKSRVIRGSEWYADRIQNKPNELSNDFFAKVHDIQINTDYESVFKNNIRHSFLDYADNSGKYIGSLSEELRAAQSLEVAAKPFYELKSIFLKTKPEHVSAGCILLWPQICGLNVGVEIVFKGEVNANSAMVELKKKVAVEDSSLGAEKGNGRWQSINFIKTFFDFVVSYNKRCMTDKRANSIKQIEIEAKLGEGVQGKDTIVIICYATDMFPSFERMNGGGTTKLYGIINNMVKSITTKGTVMTIEI